MKSPEIIIEETMNWVNKVVIGLNFCPFAGPVVRHQRLHVEVVPEGDIAVILEKLIRECYFLDTSEQYETSLIVLPEFGAHDENPFESYLDILEMAESLLEKMKFKGVYQVAGFHPDYYFEGTSKDDPANYTNRSPYPMFHVILEASVEDAIANYPNVDEIPVNNKKLARERGEASMRALRDSCFLEE
ncbi:MAG TPA: DUF1415 domain-containing protein [Saprospiraceae bacterium]|nr:DUF1415 domain-containing protein [Saprospiraceae bacterium]